MRLTEKEKELRRLVPRHWNRRVFTLADFEMFCSWERIIVFDECAKNEPGYYSIFAGHPTIWIDPRVKRNRRLWVLFHELAHHWLHTPEAHAFGGNDDKADADAEIVAVCSLIPKWLLKEKRLQEIIEDYGYPQDLISARAEIYRRHKI